MAEVLALLQTFFREAWSALAGVLLALALLAALAQVLRVSSGAVIGANLWVWEGIAGIAGVVTGWGILDITEVIGYFGLHGSFKQAFGQLLQ